MADAANPNEPAQPAEPAAFTVTGGDGTTVACWRWAPEGEPRGVVQLTHGMGEHLRRYGHLARTLTARGWLVQGQDHRGHGATAGGRDQGSVGAAGWAGIVDDIGVLVERARAEHPGLPLALLGHSMGSFAVQQWMLDHSAEVDAVVLTGTAAIDLLAGSVDLDGPMDLSAFNAPFAPARTDYDWLSRDDAQVDAYVADPACGFGLDAGAARAMFEGSEAVADPDRLAAVRPDLPVLVQVGDADPVNAGLALVEALVDRLRAAGLGDVTVRAYPGARHEVFNETNRDEVEADLAEWLDRATGAA